MEYFHELVASLIPTTQTVQLIQDKLWRISGLVLQATSSGLTVLIMVMTSSYSGLFLVYQPADFVLNR